MKKFQILTDEKLHKIIEDELQKRYSSTRKSYEQEILIKQANITALQAQINPHFLYNALECIRAQAIKEGSEEIAAVTQALSRFFRYNISSMSNLITLKEELDNVKNYMLIQQYRFKDRISIETDYDAEDTEIMETLLPKLVLQPIIENSIVHGFKDITRDAVIKIKIDKTENHVDIVISDNGTGMKLEKLNELKQRMHSQFEGMENESEGNGIALPNVNRRLELFFGKGYGINLYSCPGEGTDVELFLPLHSPMIINDES